jgi:hypothetical protein
MQRAVAILVLVYHCFALSSCAPPPEPLNIQIPPGLVTTTGAQKKLVANLKSFPRGMALQDAKRVLGPPTQEQLDSLFYYVIESEVEGRYYVTATLTFEDGGLNAVEVGYGHEELSHDVLRWCSAAVQKGSRPSPAAARDSPRATRAIAVPPRERSSGLQSKHLAIHRCTCPHQAAGITPF